MNSNVLNIEFHYFLSNQENAISIVTHNDCEVQLYESILRIAEIFGISKEEIKIYLEIPEVGSFKDRIKIIVGNNTIINTIIASIFVAWCSTFFNPQQTKEQKILNRIEIVSKLKTGNFTEEELNYILQNDENLKSFASKYYTNVNKDDNVNKIETRLYDGNVKNCKNVTTIEKKDFSSFIIEDKVVSETKTYKGISISIISPILVDDKRLVWKGLWQRQPISFKIEDEDFLKQVYNKEIKFGTGTTITGDLKEIITHKVHNSVTSEEYKYAVISVDSWSDDEHFQYKTKRYRKINSKNEKQLNLFTDANFH